MHIFLFGVGGGNWASKIIKKNEKEGGGTVCVCGGGGGRSQSILMPEKEMEIIFVTPLWILT